MRYLVLFAAFSAVLAGCAPVENAGTGRCPVPGGIVTLHEVGGRHASLAAASSAPVALAVWESMTGAPVRVAVTGRDGRWEPAIDISEPGATAPVGHVDGAGRATVVWDGYDGAGRAVRFADRRPDGTWTAARTLGTASGPRPRRPSLAAAPSGALWAAWQGDPDGALMTAFRTPDGRWRTPEVLLARGDVREVLAVVDAGGRRLVLWVEGRGDGAVVRVAEMGGAGRAVARDLSPEGESATDLRVAASPDGPLAIAWRSELPRREARVDVRIRDAVGTWGPRRTVGPLHRRPLGLPRPPGPPDRAPAITVDETGGVIVAWPQREDHHDRVRWAAMAPGAAPSDPRLLSESSASGVPALATGPDGTVIAVWEDLDGPRLTVRAAFAASGSREWAPCGTLSTPGTEIAGPRVAWSPAAAAPVVVWGSSDRGSVLAATVPPG